MGEFALEETAKKFLVDPAFQKVQKPVWTLEF